MKPGRKFTVRIGRDEKDYFVATVHAHRGCHIHAKNLDTLMKRVREVTALCLEGTSNHAGPLEVAGMQQICVWRVFHAPEAGEDSPKKTESMCRD